MKRIAVLIMIVGILVTAAIAQELTTQNAVGVLKLQLERGKFHLISLNVEKMAGGSVITNVLDYTEVPSGTKAYVWDSANQMYQIESVATLPPPAGWKPGTNVINHGDALWIKVPAAAASPTYDITMFGQVPDSTNASAEIVASGFSFISYSFPAEIHITNTTLSSIVQPGDKVYIWNTASNVWDIESWATLPPPAGWKPGTHVFSPGEGVIYNAVFASPRTWNETKPYVWP